MRRLLLLWRFSSAKAACRRPIRCWSRRRTTASASRARCWGVSICLWTLVSASQPQSGSSCSIASQQALEVGADQPWELDQQREIDRGEIHQLVGEVVERAVGEAVELVDRLMGELGDMRAGELLLGGAAVLAAAVLGFAA